MFQREPIKINQLASLRVSAGLVLTAGLCAAASLSGCLYDPDERCGENQYFEDDACKCEDGAVINGTTCEFCDEHEIAEAGVCVCAPGYIIDSTGNCAAGILGLEDPCQTDAECSPAGASFCATDDVGSYCTLSGCESAQDCPQNYGCDIAQADGVCVRGPTGYGAECESADDCSEFGANYCEAAQENICMVNCLADPNVCHGDWGCCDFSALIGAAVCVSPVDFTDGACPFGVAMLEKTP